jgi:3-phenylpropionate/trans-cinnamate dioxygenase ferredoxin subunit
MGGPNGALQRKPVAQVDELAPGTVKAVKTGDRTLALVNYGGWFFAIDHDCTHAGGPLGEGRVGSRCLLECPWHRAVFDIRTGQVRRGPARKPLRTYPVTIEGDTVFVTVPG